MSIKLLIQLKCDFCDKETQTTADIELDQFQEYGEDKLALKIIPEYPAGWDIHKAFWTPLGGHKCPDCPNEI